MSADETESCLGPEYGLETRTCDGCANFKDMGWWDIPICTKHLMGVGRKMKVTYMRAKGTCFVERAPTPSSPDNKESK